MKKVVICYNSQSKFPWILKHPKKDSIIAEFKSQLDAFNWYISFKIETLILFTNKKNELIGQIAYFKDKDRNNRFIFIAQSYGFENGVDYTSICSDFGIDPLKFSKLKTDAEIEKINKDLIFIFHANPMSYFEPKYEIKKRTKDEYLNNEAKDKIFQIQNSGLANTDKYTRVEVARTLNNKYDSGLVNLINVSSIVSNDKKVKEINDPIKQENIYLNKNSTQTAIREETNKEKNGEITKDETVFSKPSNDENALLNTLDEKNETQNTDSIVNAQVSNDSFVMANSQSVEITNTKKNKKTKKRAVTVALITIFSIIIILGLTALTCFLLHYFNVVDFNPILEKMKLK
ncbi:MAG3090 family protein [Mycoplasma tauri]|uniref:MAG3090 family protein n=1 Tax=Mycoplasma tauri TaxID=547987 RepID=UPI001CBE6148|nr:hypothetical protein [Mycoplasma tauri]MBZ4204071.1 hypothetical protein [Mycoplasma tauri]